MKLTDLELFESYALYITASLELYKTIEAFPLSNLMGIAEFSAFSDALENNPNFATQYDEAIRQSYDDAGLDYEETIKAVFDIVKTELEKNEG